MNSDLLTKSIEGYQNNDYSACRREERAWGVVQGIDLVGRDVTVLLQTGVEVFDIPPDCPILLHGEQIKLRMVQPRDYVWITFHRTPQRAVAEKVEVQPDTGFSCFRL
jgi:hypothetical protein